MTTQEPRKLVPINDTLHQCIDKFNLRKSVAITTLKGSETNNILNMLNIEAIGYYEQIMFYINEIKNFVKVELQTATNIKRKKELIETYKNYVQIIEGYLKKYDDIQTQLKQQGANNEQLFNKIICLDY